LYSVVTSEVLGASSVLVSEKGGKAWEKRKVFSLGLKLLNVTIENNWNNCCLYRDEARYASNVLRYVVLWVYVPWGKEFSWSGPHRRRTRPVKMAEATDSTSDDDFHLILASQLCWEQVLFLAASVCVCICVSLCPHTISETTGSKSILLGRNTNRSERRKCLELAIFDF